MRRTEKNIFSWIGIAMDNKQWEQHRVFYWREQKIFVVKENFFDGGKYVRFFRVCLGT